jgi:hypothetical protein
MERQMPKNLSRLVLIASAVSIVWFVGFSIIAIGEWSHRGTERSQLYEQCLEETPNVGECRSLRASTLSEDAGDVLRDFAITGIAPIAILWVAVWFVRKRRARQTGAGA